MSYKPSYLLFYQHDSILEQVINKFPFSQERPLKEVRSKDEYLAEYEHYILKAKKINRLNESIRGYKAWGVLVERSLFESTLDFELVQCMVAPYGIIGFVNHIYPESDIRDVGELWTEFRLKEGW